METERDAIKEFVKAYENISLKSTSATVVNEAGPLYNVDGSKDDPLVPGSKSWKKLLEHYNIGGNCYVGSPDTENSHPQFSLGGHMTYNSSGEVEEGHSCYLMPLCSEHNNKKWDGTAFVLNQHRMLRLDGFMEKDTYHTFIARMDPLAQTVILNENEPDAWTVTKSSEKYSSLKEMHSLQGIRKSGQKSFLLFNKTGSGNEARFQTVDHNL